jgi:hypothetical protein
MPIEPVEFARGPKITPPPRSRRTRKFGPVQRHFSLTSVDACSFLPSRNRNGWMGNAGIVYLTRAVMRVLPFAQKTANAYHLSSLTYLKICFGAHDEFFDIARFCGALGDLSCGRFRHWQRQCSARTQCEDTGEEVLPTRCCLQSCSCSMVLYPPMIG